MNKNLKSFYKYYNIEAGIKTLFTGRLKWSSPFIFNDPFDNQCNIQFKGTIDDLNNGCSKILQDHLLGIHEFQNKFDDKTTLLLNQLETIPKEYVPFILEIAKKQNVYTEEILEKWKDTFNSKFKNIMQDSSIFCFSEDYTNILMWSHYAGNHTGVVVNFKDYPPADSPIKMAKKVKYSDELPTFSVLDILEKKITIEQIHDAYTLTKAKCWEYEKEWRMITTMRTPKKAFEIIPFAAQEVQNIYLGCKITPENEKIIIEIAKAKYPWAKIYKAYKSPTNFALDFILLK